MKREGDDFATFQFTTADNPHIPRLEIEKARQDMDADTYRQEILAEYVDNAGALFRYAATAGSFNVGSGANATLGATSIPTALSIQTVRRRLQAV